MHIIGDSMTLTGLQLAGLKNVTIADEGNVVQKLQEIPEGTSMVIVTQGLAKVAETAIEKMRRKNIIVTEIPDKSGVSGEDTIKKLIREAIGFEMKA